MSIIIFESIFQHVQLEFVVVVQNIVFSRVDVWLVEFMTT